MRRGVVQAVEKGGSGGRYGTGPAVSAIRAKQRRHACGGGGLLVRCGR
jgi:hypothetical protein